MVKFPWARGRDEGVTFKPLDNDAGYVLEVEGYNAVALKLPGKIAKDIAGQDSSPGEDGMLGKLKTKIGRTSEADQEWLVVTNVGNTLLEDYDRFAALVAEGLTNASGGSVPISNLVISASIRITGMGQRMEERMEQQTELLFP